MISDCKEPDMLLFTVKEIADRLRVSQQTVRNLVASGKLPSVRIGNGRGTIRIPNDGVEAYLERQLQAGGRTSTKGNRRTGIGSRFKLLDADRLSKAWASEVDAE